MAHPLTSLAPAAPNGVRFKCQVPIGMKAGEIIYVSVPDAPSPPTGMIGTGCVCARALLRRGSKSCLFHLAASSTRERYPLSVYIPPEAKPGQRMQVQGKMASLAQCVYLRSAYKCTRERRARVYSMRACRICNHFRRLVEMTGEMKMA